MSFFDRTRVSANVCLGGLSALVLLVGAACSSSSSTNHATGGAAGAAEAGIDSGGTGGAAAGGSGAAAGGGSGGMSNGGTGGVEAGTGGTADSGTGEAGAKCLAPEDCAGQAVCDPQTATCSLSAACTQSSPCPNGQICSLISDSARVALTCFVACSPSISNPQSTCPNGFTCIYIGGDFANKSTLTGACYAVGTAAENASCTVTGITTGCTNPKDYCFVDDGGNGGPVCRRRCDRTAQVPGCPAGQACGNRDVCVPISEISSAKVGDSCSNLEGPCAGVQNGDVVGYCEPEVQQCLQICDLQDTGGPTCPRGTKCTLPFDQTLVMFGECK